jgi:hypothetical protein
MATPICVACGLTMRCHKNGQPVLITADRAKQKPYQFYMTDVYQCPGCKTKVVTGFSKPIESYDENFQREIAHAGADLLRAY